MTDAPILSPFQPEDIDKGHDMLIHDLEILLALALEKKFHDFESGFAAPKILLKGELSKLIARVEQGWYDNN